MPITVAEKSRPEFGCGYQNRTFKAFPALLMPFIILGGIYGGIMTPTEAAAVSVLYAIPVGLFIYCGLTTRGLLEAIAEASTTTGVVMVMFFLSHDYEPPADYGKYS